VPIPPLYRGEFDENNPAVMTVGLEPCVIVYTSAGFDDASEKVEAIPEETEEGRDARRDFFANAQPVRPDSQSRLTLQDKWMAHAGLTLGGNAVIIGAGKWMEIWNKEAWEARDTTRSSARRRETQAMARRQTTAEAGS
jgi:MraZ protein